MMRKEAALIAGLFMLASLATGQRTYRVDAQALTKSGDISSGGAFTCDLTLPGSILGDTSQEPIGAALERDRMLMARRPGMLRKHIPLSIDPATGNLLAGGRYLFDTAAHARQYKQFVEGFTLDGVKFLERPIFLDHDCHAWTTIGARDFADIHTTQVVFRTERWSVPMKNQREILGDRWVSIRRAAGQRGLTSVWLLYNDHERLASLIYFAGRSGPKDSNVPDVVALGTLQGAPALGDLLSDLPYDKVLDRTQFSWTIWFPFLAGDRGEPSLWPHSPPLAEAFSGDGVCEVSRGETHDNSPDDCGPTCGDGICQLGEGTQSCPGDCGLPRREGPK
jgi:hypothetical protein